MSQGEVRSADLILHLLIHSLTHLTLALSRVLGHKTPQSILLKAFGAPATCWSWHSRPALWNAPVPQGSAPPPSPSWFPCCSYCR